MIWLLLQAAWAACDEPVAVGDINRRALEVLDAFERLDKEALQSVSQTLPADVTCAAGKLVPSDVARVFRALGIAAYIDKDRDGAVGWFEAARALEPDYRFPEPMMGEGHPMRTLFDGLPADEVPTTPLPEPADGWLTVNGSREKGAPQGQPWLLQRFDSAGALQQTALVKPGEQPPEYAVADATAPTDTTSEPLPAPPRDKGASKKPVELEVLASGSLRPTVVGPLWGGVTLGASMPVVGGLGVTLHLAGELRPVDGRGYSVLPDKAGVLWMPRLDAGLRYRLGSDSLGIGLGARVVVAVNGVQGAPPVSIGGVAAGDLRVGGDVGWLTQVTGGVMQAADGPMTPLVTLGSGLSIRL